jgi:UDP-3-O-[3-hydroxymyristoyl] glucosamine N-acyltransferase
VATSVAELAKLVGGRVDGDGTRPVHGISSLAEAGPDQISFLANPRYAQQVLDTRAGAVVVDERFDGDVATTLIRCSNPDAALARIAEVFAPEGPVAAPGVHPTAVVSPTARLGEGVSVGAMTFIDDEVEIGPGTILRPNVTIGRGATLGGQCLIYPQVTIRERCRLGDRVIVHAGSVVGSDGFGYVMDEGRRIKVPQIGCVVLEDDVEIGANVTIDRARFGETRLERGVKIDNLVQIAHNVRIGEGTVIVSLCAIAGSTTLGKNCVLAGQVAIDGHLTIGDNVIMAAKSGVTKDVPSGSVIGGFPAQGHKADLRLKAELRRLAGSGGRLGAIERRLAALESPAAQNEGD